MSDTWYYVDATGEVKEITLKQLNKKLADDENARDLLVWCARFPNWVRAGDLPGARSLRPPPLPKVWYYADDTDRVGPITLEQLDRELVAYPNPKTVLQGGLALH